MIYQRINVVFKNLSVKLKKQRELYLVLMKLKLKLKIFMKVMILAKLLQELVLKNLIVIYLKRLSVHFNQLLMILV